MENKSTGSATRPVKKNGYSNRVRLAKRNKKENEAIARQSKYDLLTKSEKVARAKKQRGESKKVLAKLAKLK